MGAGLLSTLSSMGGAGYGEKRYCFIGYKAVSQFYTHFVCV